MLTRTETEEIKRLKSIERTLKTDGWMCEGADGDKLVFFNNDEDKMFYADYYGNIGYAPFDISSDLRKYVELEGKIMQICYN